MNNRLELIETESIVSTLESEALLPVNTAKELIIQTNEDLERATELIKALKDLQKKVHEIYDPIVEGAFKAHRTATTERKKHLEPLEQAEASLKAKRDSYLTHQEIERRKAEGERNRIEREHQAKLSEQKPQQETLPGIPPPPRKLSVERLAPRELPSIPEKPKVEGLSEIKDWKWKITDASLIPAEFWILDEKAIEAVVKVQKDTTQIPGIEVFYTIRGRQA